MDKATIGTNAGIVWRTINESGRPWKYEELKSARPRFECGYRLAGT